MAAISKNYPKHSLSLVLKQLGGFAQVPSCKLHLLLFLMTKFLVFFVSLCHCLLLSIALLVIHLSYHKPNYQVKASVSAGAIAYSHVSNHSMDGDSVSPIDNKGRSPLDDPLLI